MPTSGLSSGRVGSVILSIKTEHKYWTLSLCSEYLNTIVFFQFLFAVLRGYFTPPYVALSFLPLQPNSLAPKRPVSIRQTSLTAEYQKTAWSVLLVQLLTGVDYIIRRRFDTKNHRPWYADAKCIMVKKYHICNDNDEHQLNFMPSFFFFFNEGLHNVRMTYVSIIIQIIIYILCIFFLIIYE